MFWFLWAYAGVLLFSVVRDKLGLAPSQWAEKLFVLATLVVSWPLLPLYVLVLENTTVADVFKHVENWATDLEARAKAKKEQQPAPEAKADEQPAA